MSTDLDALIARLERLAERQELGDVMAAVSAINRLRRQVTEKDAQLDGLRFQLEVQERGRLADNAHLLERISAAEQRLRHVQAETLQSIEVGDLFVYEVDGTEGQMRNRWPVKQIERNREVIWRRAQAAREGTDAPA